MPDIADDMPTETTMPTETIMETTMATATPKAVWAFIVGCSLATVFVVLIEQFIQGILFPSGSFAAFATLVGFVTAIVVDRGKIKE